MLISDREQSIASLTVHRVPLLGTAPDALTYTRVVSPAPTTSTLVMVALRTHCSDPLKLGQSSPRSTPAPRTPRTCATVSTQNKRQDEGAYVMGGQMSMG